MKQAVVTISDWSTIFGGGDSCRYTECYPMDGCYGYDA